MQVEVIVTTAGGIEEGLIKCMAPNYLGDFSLPGKEHRQRGINRWDILLLFSISTKVLCLPTYASLSVITTLTLKSHGSIV